MTVTYTFMLSTGRKIKILLNDSSLSVTLPYHFSLCHITLPFLSLLHYPTIPLARAIPKHYFTFRITQPFLSLSQFRKLDLSPSSRWKRRGATYTDGFLCHCMSSNRDRPLLKGRQCRSSVTLSTWRWKHMHYPKSCGFSLKKMDDL
jgi:hypothetical protein